MLALAVFHNTAVVAAAAAVVAAVVAGHMQQIESSAPQYIRHYMHLHIAELICTMTKFVKRSHTKIYVSSPAGECSGLHGAIMNGSLAIDGHHDPELDIIKYCWQLIS